MSFRLHVTSATQNVSICWYAGEYGYPQRPVESLALEKSFCLGDAAEKPGPIVLHTSLPKP